MTTRLPRIGLAATIGGAGLGPFVASYTSVLLAATAVPAWYEARRELPYMFVGSAASAAGGLGLLTVPPSSALPAARLAVVGATAELAAERRLERRLGPVTETYRTGRAGWLLRVARLLVAGGAAGALLGRRSRLVSALSGAALLAGSAATRFGVFEAGRASARDPRYVVGPQRQRLGDGVAPA